MTAPRTDPQSTVPVEPLSAATWWSCLRGLRDARGLSSVEVAARAGISRTHLWNIETGKKDPTVGVVRRLASALNLPLCDLLDAARASQPITATADSGEPIELAELLREFRLRSSLEYNKSEASRLAWATAYDMLAALPVREDEPTGIDVGRVKQAVTNVAVRHHVVKDPPPAQSLLSIYGYSTTPATMDAEIAAEYDRLTREASHVR